MTTPSDHLTQEKLIQGTYSIGMQRVKQSVIFKMLLLTKTILSELIIPYKLEKTKM